MPIQSLPQGSVTESPGSVPALDRTLDILELLSRTASALTLSELSQQLALPKNAVFRITQTLLARGYLVRNEDTMQFRLTSRLFQLAPTHSDNISLPAAARDAMKDLRDDVRETVQLGVLSGDQGTIIDQIEGPEALRIVVSLGLRFPLYNNGPGKLLLAHMPPSRRDAIIDGLDLVRCTARTITDRDELRRECDRIIKRGYSVDHAEADEGIHCFAGPIYNLDNELIGSLWISGPAKRLPKSRFAELGEKAHAAGARVTRRIAEMS